MDEIDRAEAQEQMFKSAEITRVRKLSAVSVVPAPKACLNCNEPLPAQFLCLMPRRWCDSDCQEDWAKRKRLRGFHE